MDAIEELSQLSDSMWQASSLLADEDVDDTSSSRRPSTFLNVVAIGNTGAGKSAVLNSLIGHPALPTGEGGATRAPICVDLKRDGSLSSKSIILQIDSNSQQVSASALRLSLQDRLSKSSGKTRDEIYLKLRTSTAPSLKLIDLPGVDKGNLDDSLGLYAEHSDSILLVVIPAAQALEVASAKAIRIAKELDAECTRTVGVISKIDQASSEPKVLAAVQALLLNQGPRSTSDIPWVALIGQSVAIASAQSGSVGADNSLETAWRAEAESLKSILTGSPQSKLGRLALVETLAQQIQNRMKIRLPNLLSGEQSLTKKSGTRKMSFKSNLTSLPEDEQNGHSTMENSSNLTSLPEDEQNDGESATLNVSNKLPSAFSSKPDRPPTRTSSQKYAPLDWSGYFDEEDDVHIPNSDNVFHIYKAGTVGPVVFCLHGGGYSGLSFALAANKIKEKARIVALDLRGHGKSFTDNDLDLSIETLCNDVLDVLKTMYGDSPPAIVIVGHSMGGSVAVHVAAKKVLPSLAGLVVVDVVEGTAMASLMHMQKILSNRMQHFSTVEKAIEWSVKGGSLRNIESARVSIPSTLTYDDSRKCYSHRAKLEETEQYWRGWYEGLSEKFLSCPVAKLLLLAGTDRLDRALTIGQMQGKFQMVVVRHTGHAIQEDVPEEFTNLILSFISHNRIGPHGVEINTTLRVLK